MAGKTSGNADQEAVESLPSNTGQVAQPETVDAMIAATAPAEAEIPTMKELEGVRYVGFADIKSFSAEDLRSVGVEPKDEDDLVWFADNGKFVKGDRINAATRDWLATQSDFVVE